MCSLVVGQVLKSGFSVRYVTVLLYDFEEKTGPIILDTLTADQTQPFKSCNSSSCMNTEFSSD
jgi:hypothetical protein